MSDGWIKIHRKIAEHPRFQDGDWLKVWVFLLSAATHKDHRVIFKAKEITLAPGQLISSRKSISAACKVQQSKVERILIVLQNEQQIEQQTSNASRLITICNWDKYQKCEQPIDQQMNNGRTTDEQQVNTNKNGKNGNNEKKGKAVRLRCPFDDPEESVRKDRPASLEETIAFFLSRNLPESDADWFWHKGLGSGWRNGNNAIKDWKATVISWQSAGYLPSQKAKQNGHAPRKLKIVI